MSQEKGYCSKPIGRTCALGEDYGETYGRTVVMVLNNDLSQVGMVLRTTKQHILYDLLLFFFLFLLLSHSKVMLDEGKLFE
jgi:hypothetical protein